MTYPRDYRQEKTYGFSAAGVIISLIVVVAIMFVVVILSGSVIFFPFSGSYEIETSPGMDTALTSMLQSTILIAAATLAVIFGSWVYSHGRLASESQ